MEQQLDPDRPVFIPPRKRGAKSSPRSTSSHQLNASPLSGVSTPVSSLGTPQHFAKDGTTASPRLRSFSQEQVYNHQNSKISKGRKNCSFTPAKNVDIVIEEPMARDSNQCRFAAESVSTPQSDNEQLEQASERCALNTHRRSNGFVTMTGTVKRGKKKGQTMDMQVHMSREELDELEQTLRAQKQSDDDDDEDRCFFGVCKGPHVTLLSVLAFPVVLLFSGAYSFYMGTMTWYNVLVLYSEKKSLAHKVFASPVIIVCYPFLILLCTLGLGVFAAFVQVSWHFEKWKLEVVDLEKGFYGWLCCACRLEECSPYGVVILTEIQPNAANVNEKKTQISDTAL